MISAWTKRSEPLGLLVHEPSGELLFSTAGDKAHRFVTRDADMPVITVFTIHTQVRPLVAMLATGRRVGCCIDGDDDIVHVARRLVAMSPVLYSLPVAVWHGDHWTSQELHELV